MTDPPTTDPPMADPPDAPTSVDEVDDRERFVVFHLDEHAWAVPVDEVHAVVATPAVTRLPGAPDGVIGVIAERGRVLAVLDPRAAFGLAPRREGTDTRILVTGASASVGLVVDLVREVVPGVVSRGDEQPPSEASPVRGSVDLAGPEPRRLPLVDTEVLTRHIVSGAG